MMTWMLPLMLMFFTLNLPSGVGVYWVVTNIFSLGASYWVYGKRVLSWKQLLPIPMQPVPGTAPAARPSGKPKPSRGNGNTQADIEVEPDEDQPNQSEPGNELVRAEARSQYGKRRGKRKKRR